MANILVCAFCVNNKDLIDIFNNKVFPNLQEKINYCFGVKIKSTASINKLCIKCARNVDQFSSFKAQAVEAKSYLDNLLEVLKNDVSSEVVVELYKKMKSSLNKPSFLTKKNIKGKRSVNRINKRKESQKHFKNIPRTEPQQLISNRDSTPETPVACSSRTAASYNCPSTNISNYEAFFRNSEAHETLNNNTDDYIELSDSSDSEETPENILVTPDIFISDPNDSDSTISFMDDDSYACSRTTSFADMNILKNSKKEYKRHSRKLKIKSKEFIETDDDSSEYGSVLILYPRKSSTNSPSKNKSLPNEADSTSVEIKIENVCTLSKSTTNAISDKNFLNNFEISSTSLKIEYDDEQPAILPPVTKETYPASSIHNAVDETEQSYDIVPAEIRKWFIKTRPVFINGSKRPQYPCHLCRDILKTRKKHRNHLQHNHEIICPLCKMKFMSNKTLLEHQLENGCLDVNLADRKFYLKPVVRLVRFDNPENKFLNPRELLAVTSTDIQTSGAYLDRSFV